MGALLAVVICALVAIIWFVFRRRGGKRERFASARAHEVASRAQELFSANDNLTYSEFKAALPGAEPVLYTDVRNLWRKSRDLSPDAVQSILP